MRGGTLSIWEGNRWLCSFTGCSLVPSYGQRINVATRSEPDDYREVCDLLHEPAHGVVRVYVRPKPVTEATADKFEREQQALPDDTEGQAP